MADYCSPLENQDPTAFQLCGYFRDHGYDAASLDKGYTRPDFGQKGLSRVTVNDANGKSTAGNAMVEAQEVYAETSRLLLKTLQQRAGRVFDASARFDDFLTFVSGKTTFDLSFLPNGGTGDAAADKLLASWVDHPEKLAAAATRRGTTAFNRSVAEGLFNRFRSDLKLAYSADESPDRGYRDVKRILKDRTFNCIESYFFGVVCQMMGISAFPVEDLSGEHVLIGLQLDPQDSSQVTLVDFSKGAQGFGVGLPANGWIALSFNDLLATVHMNRAFPVEGSLPTDAASRANQKRELEEAMRLAPANFRVQYQMGVYRYLGGETSVAEGYFQESLRLNPNFRPAKEMLTN